MQEIDAGELDGMPIARIVREWPDLWRRNLALVRFNEPLWR